MNKDNIVIGFSGQIGSGKTLISQRLAEYFGCPVASFGDYIRKIVHSRHLLETRETLQSIGHDLVSSNIDDFCRSLLQDVHWDGGLLVVDGIRHIEVLSSLRKIVNPQRFLLIYVETAINVRFSRLKLRGDLQTDMKAIEDHPTEKQVKLLTELADLKIDGSRNINILLEEIINWLKVQ